MSDGPNELRQRYFRTLNPEPIEPSHRERRTTSLDRAYELRTFEIEHYWKRATYFWGFQIAIFAAFGFLWRGTSATASGTAWHPVALALTGLGVLTALANSLSARGSKFWQQNWERHIDMLEDKIDGRLHKTVWLDEGRVSFSVSRVNQLLSDYVVAFWCIVAFYVGWASLGAVPLGWISSAWTYVPVFGVITLLGMAWLCRQTTDFHGSLPGEDGSHGAPITRYSRWSRRISAQNTHLFVRRYAPDEESPPQ